MNENGIYVDCMIDLFRNAQRRARSRTAVRVAAGKLFRQLRRESVKRLESVLGRRSERVRRFEALVWFDDEGRLGNAQVIHCNPLIRPDTPLILTLSLNDLGADVPRACLKRLGWRGWPYFPEHSRKPSVSVKARPEEVLLFVLWAAKLVEDPERRVEEGLPVPCCSWGGGADLSSGFWTVEAHEEVVAYEEARKAEKGGDAA